MASAAAAGIGLGLAGGHDRAAPAADSVPRRTVPQRHTVVLRPPGPIPGYLLIADRGNNRMLLIDAAKRILWRYPKPNTAPDMPFRFDDDTFFGPTRDRIVSNQEEQHTIQIVSFPSGHVLWRYGHVDRKGSAPGYLNTPDDAYLLPNGLVSVADAYNCRVLFLDRAHRIVRQYGAAGACRHNPPSELGAINGATPLPDGGTLISEINGSWVDDIGPNGELQWAVQAPVSYPSDPQLLAPNRILLADYARPGHALIMTTSGKVLWRYGPSSGPGMLDHPSLAFRIAPGLIAINDDYRHRVVLVDIHKNRIVWQYGHTDVPGRSYGFLNTPDGLDLLPTRDAQRSPAIRTLLTTSAPRRRSAPRVRTAGAVAVRVSHRLPAPVERAVAVARGSSILIAGGLTAGGTSTNGVFQLDPGTGLLAHLGSVPQPFHDAAGALLGGRLVIFGGGAGTSSSAVQQFDPSSRRGTIVGRLPRALSDLVASTIGSTVYLVGGYDGVGPRAEIYATNDGRQFRVVGRTPVGLRYAAVTALGGKLVIVGGTTTNGASDAVYAFDPATRKTTRLATLPVGLAHAAALSFGNAAYVLGGTDVHDRTLGTVYKIDSAGRVTATAARSPTADAAAAQVGSTGYLIGGRRDGHTIADVETVSSR